MFRGSRAVFPWWNAPISYGCVRWKAEKLVKASKLFWRGRGGELFRAFRRHRTVISRAFRSFSGHQTHPQFSGFLKAFQVVHILFGALEVVWSPFHPFVWCHPRKIYREDKQTGQGDVAERDDVTWGGMAVASETVRMVKKRKGRSSELLRRSFSRLIVTRMII